MSAALAPAAELAHDVRSPLCGIMVLAELLERGDCGPVTAQQSHYLRLMREAALALSHLTTDILLSGDARHRGGAGAESAFDVADVLDSVRHIVRPIAEHSGHSVVVTNEAPRTWTGSGAAVTRVLLNLTTNALAHTAGGTVEYGARATSDAGLRFFVRDAGAGFPERKRRVRSAPRPGRTSGLGLVISRQLVGAMGSTLELESAPGAGCCFHFELPLQGRAGSPARNKR